MAFTEYPINMSVKVIKAFDDVIDDIISNKKLNQKLFLLLLRHNLIFQ